MHPLFTPLLAAAEAEDNSGSNVQLGVICVVVIGIVVALAAIPVLWAQRRRCRQAEAILISTMVWGLLTAGSVAYYTNSQITWTKEKLINMQSGFYDPVQQAAAPKVPWGTWLFLALVYGALLLWPRLGKRR